jgi:hypothetical protein
MIYKLNATQTFDNSTGDHQNQCCKIQWQSTTQEIKEPGKRSANSQKKLASINLALKNLTT